MKRQTILKSKDFELYRCRGRLFVTCLDPDSYPRTIRLADKMEAALKNLGDSWCKSACIEIGCGLWAREKTP